MRSPLRDRSPSGGRGAGWMLLLLALLSAVVVVVLLVRRPTPSDTEATQTPAAETASASTAASTVTGTTGSSSFTASSSFSSPSSREEWLAALREKLAGEDGLALVAKELETLARQNPKLAIDLAQAIGRNAEERYALTASAVRGWASNDPESAWQWSLNSAALLEHAGEPSFGAVTMQVAAVNNPNLVLDWVSEVLASIPEGAERDIDQISLDAVTALLQAGHRQLTRDAVESWSSGVSGSRLGNAVYELAAQQGEESPEESAAWLRGLPESDGRNYALGTIAATWAMQDPAAAMTWAFSLTGIDVRQEVMQRAFTRWADRDLLAASQWLSDHEADPAIDQMISMLVSDSPLTYSNPRVALVWAQTIADPDLRIRSMEPVVSSWSRADRDAVTRYLNENVALKPDEKERLLRALHEPTQEPAEIE